MVNRWLMDHLYSLWQEALPLEKQGRGAGLQTKRILAGRKLEKGARVRFWPSDTGASKREPNLQTEDAGSGISQNVPHSGVHGRSAADVKQLGKSRLFAEPRRARGREVCGVEEEGTVVSQESNKAWTPLCVLVSLEVIQGTSRR